MAKKLKNYEVRCDIDFVYNGTTSQEAIECGLRFTSNFNLDLSSISAYVNHDINKYDVNMSLDGTIRGSSRSEIAKKLVAISKKLKLNIASINLYSTD
tara:strand:+ start:164 stop:457 length:294 start_codon:yes stop_codon:yes gene_type:complete